MGALAIDTYRFVKRLKSVGFTEEQAGAQADAFSEALTDTLVSKADFNQGIADMRAEMAAMRVEFRDMHASLIRRLVPLMIGQTALVAALVKLL